MPRYAKALWLWLIFTALIALPSQSLSQPLCQNGSSDEQITPWDYQFQKWGSKYLQEADWRLIAAQAFQESSFNPRAVSHAGARGLMQTMPRTHAEIGEQLGVKCSPFVARCSIMYGTYYDSRMARVWRGRDRTFDEITPLMLSSYNCGAGCVINAQKKAGNARNWQDFAGYLPREAREYPIRILRKYSEFLGCDRACEEYWECRYC